MTLEVTKLDIIEAVPATLLTKAESYTLRQIIKLVSGDFSVAKFPHYILGPDDQPFQDRSIYVIVAQKGPDEIGIYQRNVSPQTTLTDDRVRLIGTETERNATIQALAPSLSEEAHYVADLITPGLELTKVDDAWEIVTQRGVQNIEGFLSEALVIIDACKRQSDTEDDQKKLK